MQRTFRFPHSFPVIDVIVRSCVCQCGCDDPDVSCIDLIDRRYRPHWETPAEPIYPDLYEEPLLPEYTGELADAYDLDEDEPEKKSRGGPANKHPYPVDEKVEQLQSRDPLVKFHQYSYCEGSPPSTIEVMDTVMDQSDRIEKRLTRIENILAATMRYMYRTASRIQVNCVYYGGQEVLEKYSSIRCLHDDRVDDGQLVSLDQCLNCTRYEPVYGQVYEILNEQGEVLEQVLDDMQAAYKTREEQAVFSRTDKMHEQAPLADCTEERLPTEERPPGEFQMDWDKVPIEDQ